MRDIHVWDVFVLQVIEYERPRLIPGRFVGAQQMQAREVMRQHEH